MSVRFDLTAIGPELMDAVIYMDNSPAYAAFKDEIEAILRQFNETKHLSSHWTVDEADLTANAEETLKNMQRGFLLWSNYEEKQNGIDIDCSCNTMGKLFIKSQFDTIVALNGGSETVAASDALTLINSFKDKINSDEALYASVKEYFKNYVYGYFFNYLKEAEIMKNYAEMLAYLGVVSNIIPTSIAQQQKAVSKMAPLLLNNRFKYVYGFVPADIMLNIVYERIEFAGMSEDEVVLVKTRIKEFIYKKYRTDNEEGVELLSDDVTASFASDFFGNYINVPAFSKDLYRKTANGVRTFLDCDRDDTGDYSASKISDLASAKCAVDHNTFFTTERAACNDTALAGEELCWKYPIIFKDENDYWFAEVYEEHIYPVLDDNMFVAADIPSGTFAFADNAFKTNSIRAVAGIADNTVTVRRDRLDVLEKLKAISADSSLSARDRKMQMLEQTLCLMSSNCSESKYKALISENVFGTDLYEEYIRYRADLLVMRALENQDTKKKLLDDFNKIW